METVVNLLQNQRKSTDRNALSRRIGADGDWVDAKLYELFSLLIATVTSAFRESNSRKKKKERNTLPLPLFRSASYYWCQPLSISFSSIALSEIIFPANNRTPNSGALAPSLAALEASRSEEAGKKNAQKQKKKNEKR